MSNTPFPPVHPESISDTDTGARATAIPEQVVAEDGTIEIPYVGRVQVADRTHEEVESLIVRSLKGKSIEPRVGVTGPPCRTGKCGSWGGAIYHPI
jgi:protein involved in polysaccharide export with SLBB domain